MAEKTNKKSAGIDRRTFLKGLMAAPLAATPVASMASHGGVPSKAKSDQFYGYLYDATKCIGCGSCTNACIKTNTLPEALEKYYPETGEKKQETTEESLKQYFFRGETASIQNDEPRHINTDDVRRDPSWFVDEQIDLSKEVSLMRIRSYSEESYVKEQCMHCIDPACVSACPVTAMVKDPDTGIVWWNIDNCIGCRYCMMACPYNVIYHEWEKAFPKIIKCTLCKDTNLKEKGIPACVDACPNGALKFDTRNNLLDEAHRRLEQCPDKYVQKVYGEHDGGGTSVLILAGTDFSNLNLPKLKNESPARDSEWIQGIYTYMLAPVVAYASFVTVALHHYNKNKEEEEGH